MYGLWNPLVYVLMKNRKANDYFAMWSKFVEIAVSFNCDVSEDVILYLDFEKAAASAFKTVFPDGIICRCFFHFWQTAIRKLKKFGLYQDYKTQEGFRQQVRSILALAFLPPHEVISCFLEISAQFDQVILLLNLSQLFHQCTEIVLGLQKAESFVNYFRKTFIQGSLLRTVRGGKRIFASAMYTREECVPSIR